MTGPMHDDRPTADGTTDGTARGTTGFATGAPPPRAQGMQQLWDAMRRTGVRRPVDDRWVGGVCAGVARRLGVDPVLLRAAVVALVLLGGAGVVAYAFALVLLPDHDDRIELERASYGDLTGTTVGAVALLLLAVVVPGPWDLWRDGTLVDGGEVVGALLLGTLLLIGLAFLPRLREATEGDGTRADRSPASGAGDGSLWVGGTGSATVPPYGPQPRYTPPPVRPRPYRRGPGPAVSAAVTGTALLAGGGAWLAADAGLLEGRPWLLAACAALAVLGVGLLGLGLAGRRDGSVGGAAFLVVVLTLLVLLVPSWRTTQLAGDVTWRPTGTVAAERGGTIGLGEGVLDLSGLDDLPAGAGVEVPVRVGIGSLQVLVPDDMDVTVVAGSLVGTARDATSGDDVAGVAVERTLRRGDTPQVVVDARALVGDVEVVEVP